jgi:hypothetical protein
VVPSVPPESQTVAVVSSLVSRTTTIPASGVHVEVAIVSSPSSADQSRT